MTDSSDLLSRLRAEIDQIDDAAHDLFMRRAEIVQKIAATKNGGEANAPIFAMRPGREAQIMRRLVSRHRGDFPVAAIARMWRELITASSGMQGPFEVAIYGSNNPAGYLDIARWHFGVVAPSTLHNSAAQVLQRVGEGKGVVGILPLPGGGDPGGDWWPALASQSLRIVARLPFLRMEGSNSGDGVAGATIDREETGDDSSFLLAFCRNEMSRAAVRRLLADSGIDCRPLDTHKQDKRLMLFDTKGYLTDDDIRLARAVASEEKLLERIVVAGGYAQPLKLPA